MEWKKVTQPKTLLHTKAVGIRDIEIL